MTQLSLSIPIDGQPFATEGPKVGTSLTSIQSVVNGGLDTANLSPTAGVVGTQLASATVADDRLASPNNVVYKTIQTSGSYHAAGTSGNTYGATTAVNGPFTSGSAASGFGGLWLDPADYAVAGKTTKYRLRVVVGTNAQAPTSTFTFGLYPVSSVSGPGGTANITTTLGTVVSGSTFALVAPLASSINQGNSGDFTPPAAGLYNIGWAISVASMAANSAITVGLLLQVRQV